MITWQTREITAILNKQPNALSSSVNSASAFINLAALSANFEKIKSWAPKSKIMAVCKANGYGHGLVEVAKTLKKADAFGVARIQEAYALRQGGINQPIVLLEGFFEAADLPQLVSKNIETVIHCEEQLLALEESNLSAPLKVWLKIDTGMSRVGILPEQVTQFYQRLKANPNVASNITLMSHFACADDLSCDMTTQQLSLFESIEQSYPAPSSLANSAAIINYPSTHKDVIRPGLILYGATPTIEHDKNLDLRPVMTLKSRLIAIKKIHAGSTVGYGATWKSKHETIIGIVAIGYGDGYPRHAKTGTPVLVNGRRVPLVGRVSMDMITVDLGTKAEDKNGDEAVLWGEDLPVEEIARNAETIAYELLCGLTARVKLVYFTRKESKENP